MRPFASALLLSLMAQEPVCDHGTRGPAAPVNLREVARLHDEMSRHVDSLKVNPPSDLAWPAFESGLPACRTRKVRRHSVVPLPSGMKPLFFAPAGSAIPPDALWVATKARSIRDVAIPADPHLAARLGVTCAPTLVRPISATEVELLEGGGP